MNLAYLLFAAGLGFLFVVWVGRSGARTPMEFLKRKGRKAAGVALAALGLFLAARGRWDIGVLIAGAGWLMVTGNPMPNLHPMAWIQSMLIGKPKPKSLAFEGDDDAVVRITLGRFAGRTLNDLSQEEFIPLLQELSRLDPAALVVIEKHLDGRFAGWREDMQANPHRWGIGGAGGGSGNSDRRISMSEDEAYEILGLAPGAGAEAIRDAHRVLIKKLHPDQGGSTYLAARVNDAKAVLMKRHK
jgi:DnaJ domain